MYKQVEAQKSNSLLGKTFYQRLAKDDHYFRTITFRANPFNSGELTPMKTEFIYGEPTPNMEPLPPLLASRLFRTWT